MVSSDFCHWGSNFDYYHYEKPLEVWQSVEKLDRRGMELIEKHDFQGYHKYLEETENTICGRHPIGVYLSALKSYQSLNNLGDTLKTTFLKYAQSNQAKRKQDSSVSYASSLTYISP